MAGEDIIDVSAFTAAVHVPKTNEPVSAATLKIPLQALANRTKFLTDADTALTAYVDAADAAHDATLEALCDNGGLRVVPFVSFEGGNANQWGISAGIGEWTQLLVTGTATALIAPISLPTGTIITRIDAHVISPGHAAFPGGAPAVMPSIGLVEVDISTGALIVDNETDSSATAGTYNIWHTISMTGLSVTIDNANKTHCLIMYGESGANSIAGAFRTRGIAVYLTPIT